MILRLAAIIMFFNFLVLTYVLYLAFWPFHVIDVEPQPYVLESTIIDAGSYIFYEFQYCKYFDVKADIIYQLENTKHTIAIPNIPPQEIDDYTLRLEDVCASATKAVYIPRHTPQGAYKLVEYIDYRVNAFQTVSYKFQTEEFFVTNKN